MSKSVVTSIDDLAAAPYNPRKQRPKAAAALQESLAKFGDISGITFNRTTGRLVCGHQRVAQLRELGAQLFQGPLGPELRVGADGKVFPVRLVDWDEATEIAANITANNEHIAGTFTSDLGQLLESVLGSIGPDDFKAIGLDDLLRQTNAFGGDDYTPVDERQEAQGPADTVTKLGDVWRLGDHILVCGDALDGKTYTALPERASMTVTSPPYNIGAQPRDRFAKYDGSCDTLDNDVYRQLLDCMLEHSLKYSKYSFINLQLLASNKRVMAEFIGRNVNQLADVMVWNKCGASPPAAARVLKSVFEFVFVFSHDSNRAIGTRHFHGELANLFEADARQKRYGGDVHRASFPVAFAEHLVGNFSNMGEWVIDPFAGTGTTMIACDGLHRRCFSIELNPLYCDLIVKRWEEHTGNKATRD